MPQPSIHRASTYRLERRPSRVKIADKASVYTLSDLLESTKLFSWVLNFSFTRLFTTSNATKPTISAQNHSRKRRVSPLTIVFLAVRPHKFETFRVSKKVETNRAADA